MTGDQKLLYEIKGEIGTLKGELSGLKDVTAEGFKGVHARQDRTNGNVLKNSSRLDVIEKEENKFRTESAVSKFKLGFIWTIIMLVITTVMTTIINLGLDDLIKK